MSSAFALSAGDLGWRLPLRFDQNMANFDPLRGSIGVNIVLILLLDLVIGNLGRLNKIGDTSDNKINIALFRDAE